MATKNERTLIIITAAAAVLFLGDRYVAEPYLATREQLRTDIETARDQERKDRKIAADARRANRRWAEMTRSGLRSEPQAAESQMLQAIQDWASSSGITLTGIKPDRTETDKQFRRIVFRVAATGNMSSFTRFLWRIQNTTAVPARVVDISVTSKKEGADDLNVSLGISTLLLASEPDKNQPGGAAAPAAAPHSAAPGKEPA